MYTKNAQKNEHWSELATFEEYWYTLEYNAPLISTSTNFLQPTYISSSTA